MAKDETLRNVEYDISKGNYEKARARLHSLIWTYPDDLDLRRRLGDIYWLLQIPKKAGQYWYLEKDKTPEMESACKVFEAAYGGDPLLMLQELKFQGDRKAIV